MARRRVLLIDDAESVRAVLRLVFELAGFDVVGEAADGRKAIDRARELVPDVIVADWQMPVMSGLDALPLLRAAVPDAVIVMFSSRLGYENRERALAAGADAYVEKGASPEDVLACVRHLLERRSP